MQDSALTTEFRYYPVMFVLLIALCVMPLGNISAQQVVFTQIVNTQAIPIVSTSPRDINRRSQASIPSWYQRSMMINQLRSNGSEDRRNLPPTTVRNNQPSREVFVPQRDAATIPPTQPTVTEKNAPANSTAPQNVSDVYDSVNFENPATSSAAETTTASSEPENRPDRLSSPSGPVEPVDPGAQPKADEVTPSLDQRGAFDGDKCPTGYVRVNGSTECVQPD